MVGAGYIIRPSTSEFTSPIVLVHKKDGSRRLCVDYRRLNKVIVRDHFPIPLIEDIIGELHSAKVFTTLDLENGFFHVPVDEESVKYTAFVTPFGEFEFLKTPFGLSTSPTVFQRFINDVFRDLIRDKIVVIYIDDLLILAENEEEGLRRLKLVLDVAAKNGLRIKWRKCQFLQPIIEYLGYEVNEGEIRPTPGKTEAVMKFPEPRCYREVQQFLGLTGYFRKFVEGYSVIAKPLTDLLKKDAIFVFGPEQRAAMETLKSALCSRPALSLYHPNALTELHTDASRVGFGAILLQKLPGELTFHPVYFYSKKTSPAEANYPSYELEVLAIVAALKKFRVYLLGIPFKIVTDCAAFKMTMEKKEIAPRIAGWALLLQEFEYILEHRPGTKMRHVDALSRNPTVLLLQANVIEMNKARQRNDEKLGAIIKALDVGSYGDFFTDHGILYKNCNGGKLLVIPSGMHNTVIRSVHEQGHFGPKKMSELIMREYWIDGLATKLEKHVASCIPCILASRKMGKKEGFLHPIPKDEVPLSTYHIDHLGPLTASGKQYRYILSIIDAFSKYVWLYPVKTTTTDEVLKKMEVQKCIFGNPKRIISDRGSAFTSTAFENYCAEEGIEHLLITTGVPRGNGQVERIHGVVVPALAKLSIDNPELWYRRVGDLQRFLNNSLQRSTGRTPFEVLFGTKMRSPEDVKLAETVEQEWIELFEEAREQCRIDARNNIERAQQGMKKQFDRHRKDTIGYEVGDLVAISRTQFGSHLKIAPKFFGPYRVTKKKRNERYDVEKIGVHEGPNRTSTCAEFMKRFVPLDGEDDITDDEVPDEDGPSPSGPDGGQVGRL